MAYWLVTTDHLEDRLLFMDFRDFVVGMNYVAVQAYKAEVSVLSFVLMSNHLHFVLCASRDQAEMFVNSLKTTYSRYLWSKYGSKEHLRRLGVDFKLIEGDEALEWAVAYVQMNPVAANICLNPFDYPWGTGGSFFKPVKQLNDETPSPGMSTVLGRSLGDMSERERFRLLQSRQKVPDKWLVGDDGYVLPESYVCVDFVESVFRTPRRMQYFLLNSSKAKHRLVSDDGVMPAFRDQIILAAIPDLCQSLFGKRTVDELAEEQLVELLRQLRFRFSAGVNQLARVTGLSYAGAAKFLDKV